LPSAKAQLLLRKSLEIDWFRGFFNSACCPLHLLKIHKNIDIILDRIIKSGIMLVRSDSV